MMDCVKVAAVLLAAGAGSRFGGNKLEAMFGEAMLGLHAARTLAGVGCGHLFVVYDPAHGALSDALAPQGYHLIANTQPELGMGHSLALAVQAAETTDVAAILVCLADMPFVTADHLGAIVAAGQTRIIASSTGTARMPPVLIPRHYWPALSTASGDLGARGLLVDADVVIGTPEMLADIDTKSDLDRFT